MIYTNNLTLMKEISKTYFFYISLQTVATLLAWRHSVALLVDANLVVSVRLCKLKAHFSTELPLLQMPAILPVSPSHPHFWPTLWPDYKFGGPHNLLRFDNSLEQLTELKKVLCLLLQFCYPGIQIRRTSEMKTHRMGSGRRCRAPVLSLHGIRACHPPCTSMSLPARELHMV